MKNEIQKLISKLEIEKENADKDSDHFKHNPLILSEQIGRVQAFSFCIHKLKLLLKDESKQPQPPDFANTMLGEVPHVVNDKQEGNLKAVEGATPVVRQNEQTKKVCNHKWERGYRALKCSKCGELAKSGIDNL